MRLGAWGPQNLGDQLGDQLADQLTTSILVFWHNTKRFRQGVSLCHDHGFHIQPPPPMFGSHVTFLQVSPLYYHTNHFTYYHGGAGAERQRQKI